MDQIATCDNCDELLRVDSLSCPKCGRPVEPEVIKRVGPSVSIIGALFVTAGPFLPWLTDGIVSANGVEATKKAAVFFVALGILSAMFSLSAFTGKKFHGLGGTTMAGVLGGGLATYLYIRLPKLIAHRDLGEHFGEKDLGQFFGSGIYFCIVGSALLIVGGLLTRSPRPKEAPAKI